MKKFVLLPLLFVLFTTANAQQEKQIWAKSYLNKKSPEFVIEKWLSKKPNTTGKFILIDFWATWCGPCKKAIPELNNYQKEFKDNLVVIGISDESKSTVKKMKSPSMNYYSAIDTEERMKKRYKVEGIPHCVLIDPNGIVRWEGFPGLKGFELTSQIIENIIEKYK